VLILSDSAKLLTYDIAAPRVRLDFNLVTLPTAIGNSLIELAPLWPRTVIDFL